MSFGLNRRIEERFKTFFPHTFAGPRFCCGLFGKWSQSFIPSVSARWFWFFLTTLTFCVHRNNIWVSLRVNPPLFHSLCPVSSGLQTPSLTTDWCCSPPSCSRREAHVEVSPCSNTNRRPHTLKDTHILDCTSWTCGDPWDRCVVHF